GDGDVAGHLTAGWFAYNPTYAARPDNTGNALLRYAAHAEVSVWHHRVALGVDGTLFTDRHAEVAQRPSELDLTVEAVGRWKPFELRLAYERDMPVDRGGLVQHFVYVLASWSFDLRRSPAP